MMPPLWEEMVSFLFNSCMGSHSMYPGESQESIVALSGGSNATLFGLVPSLCSYEDS